MKKLVFGLIFALFLGSLLRIQSTKSFFSDTEKVTGSVLSVATTFVTITPTPTVEPTPTVTPTPTPIPTATPTPITNHLVINEVYYDAIDDDSLQEWIELYNAGSGAVDLSFWKLTDLEGTFVIPSGTVVNSDSFLVIARNQTGFFSLYGFNPDISGLNLSLANDGDEIILRTPGDTDIDAVVYESGSYGGITPHPGVSTGHSIGRSPKGVDTDNCSADFIDQTIPTPGS